MKATKGLTMSYKTDRKATGNGADTSDTASDTTAPAVSMLADLSRQQMALATDFACALFRGSEAIRHIQQQVAHKALERHQSAAQKLRDSREPADLLAVQTELMRFDMDGAAQYWQQLANATFKTQAELMGCLGSSMATTQPVGGLKPMLEGWQAIFSPKNGNSSSHSAGA
jgi:phasin family protein